MEDSSITLNVGETFSVELNESTITGVISTITPRVLTAASIEQNGITVNFDKAVPVGQYADGSWWARPAAGDSTVTVVSHTPDYDPVNKRNGAQSNPGPGDKQAYDSRVLSWDETKLLSLPHVVTPGTKEESLVFSSSLASVGSSQGVYIDKVIVLTIPAAMPPPDAFRPPYYGTYKPVFRTSQLLQFTSELEADLLPSLPDPASFKTAIPLSDVEERYQYVQLDQVQHPDSRYYTHPLQSFHAFGNPTVDHNYPAAFAADNAKAICRLCLDDAVDDKTTSLIRVVQAGIDWYGIAKAGTRLGSSLGQGGHSVGRKLIACFAAWQLNDADMIATVGGTTHWAETDQVYFSASAGDGTAHFDISGVGMVLFGAPNLYSKFFPYDSVTGGAKDRRDNGPGYIDGGDPSAKGGGTVNPGDFYLGISMCNAFFVAAICSIIPALRPIYGFDPIIWMGDRLEDFGYWMQPDPVKRPATYPSGATINWAAIYGRHGGNPGGAAFESTYRSGFVTAMRNAHGSSTFRP